jgi:hypothetical protein
MRPSRIAVPGPLLDRADARPAAGASAGFLRLSLGVAALQGLLVLSWTLYSLFLPALAARAGLPRGLVVWLLMLDQLTFALGDWAAGLYADRLAGALRRLGPPILVASIASAALLCILPAVATLGSPQPLVAAALAWAFTSSMLRAPVFTLLGRMGGVSQKTGVINRVLVGVSLAGALGPLVTEALRGVDARWPLALAALALVAATLPVLGLDHRPGPRPPRLSGAALRAVIATSVATLFAAFGVQLLTVLMPTQLAAASSLARLLWAPLFWGGFSIGLLLGALSRRSHSPARWEAAAFALGTVAIAAVPHASSLALLLPALGAAGGCWAVVYTSGLLDVLRLGRGGRLATPLGIYLSAISLAAASRLLLAGLGWASALPAADVALLAWLAGGVCLLLNRQWGTV